MADDEFGFGSFGFDPEALSKIPLFQELQRLMSWDGGAVNWDLARQMAHGIAGEPRLAIGVDSDTEAWADAVLVAESWLDPHTTLAAVHGPALALTAQEWVTEATTEDGLARYVEPVATGMKEAMGRQVSDAGLGPMGGLGDAMTPITAMLTGMQVGQIAGNLAAQLLGSYDLGVPTLPTHTVATVGDTAAVLAEEADLSADEVRFWLALREVVHRRIYGGVDWVLAHLTSELGRFAGAMELDVSGLSEQLGDLTGLDPSMLSDPDALRRMAEESGASITPTDAQREILARLQALVSLVAGYADVMVRRAADGRLPNLARVEEVTMRRRAEGGAGERSLTALLGLDLRPEDVRTGERFCEAVLTARGPLGLDVVWRDPAHLPTPAEIADPSRWLLRLAAEEAESGQVIGGDGGEDLGVEIPDDLGGLDLD